MRTTITIEDQLLARLKHRAAASGETVSGLIEDSVRLMLAQAEPSARDEEQAFRVVTYGKGGRFTELDVDRVSTLQELDDLDTHGPRR